jgi:hypothetical protein
VLTGLGYLVWGLMTKFKCRAETRKLCLWDLVALNRDRGFELGAGKGIRETIPRSGLCRSWTHQGGFTN